jgi:hypothetical protein
MAHGRTVLPGLGDRGCSLDLSPCSRVVEALDYAVDELADLAIELAVMTEEDAQDFGKVGASGPTKG